MKVSFRPRFFIIFSVLMVGIILFASNVLIKKRVEVKIVDSKESGSVLAAGDNSKGSYALIESSVSKANGPQEESISSYEPVTISYTVKEGDTLESVAEKYHADPQTIADFPNNGLGESLQLTIGQILIIPNGYIDDSQKPVLPPIARGTGQFSWPANGEITQYAFYWHKGAIDIAIPQKTPIHAADDGTVKYVERLTTGYGTHVIIEHGDGLTSLYAHLSEVQVVQGQGIRKGDILGLSGSTGRSTGPHLHFEVRKNGVPIDPMTLLPSR